MGVTMGGRLKDAMTVPESRACTSINSQHGRDGTHRKQCQRHERELLLRGTGCACVCVLERGHAWHSTEITLREHLGKGAVLVPTVSTGHWQALGCETLRADMPMLATAVS